ncbi:GNAT family N-acetyltransferase [Ectobacillus ponti]|uniref:GNAT family N-acetyltransferase n=1 Tax=Ectobacillus ponti TaxID=2961894 RepID=A0AA41X3D2_9BACI|nr:GNAT family N-acetyltransferase [Ectobacillus ponti]MCP8968196.1 GNAT family N-acetyltransferase [Ectobacillus ponti]
MGNSETVLKQALELDFVYMDTFTTRIPTAWGYLFCNEGHPAYYTANHAHLYDAPQDPKAVIEEVLQFYGERNLVPRFYIYNLEQQTAFLREVQNYGFRYEELVSPVQVWDKQLPVLHGRQGVVIEQVTEANFQEALDIECSIPELGGRAVREKAFTEEFQHPCFTHYLLRLDGTACAVACLFSDGKQGRIESVATKLEFRGKGLIGELIRFIQAEAKQKELENLWIFPINERVERVYARYGFQTAGTFRVGHAFLSGKSIHEINQG